MEEELKRFYKAELEKLMRSICNFNIVDTKIEKGITIPLVPEEDRPDYQSLSNLGSRYIFLRNNIHIERLSEENREKLIRYYSSDAIGEDFIKELLPTLLFEDGEENCYGTALPENIVPSKSIVLTFAYNERECEVEQGVDIQNRIREVFTTSEELKKLESYFGIKLSMLISNSFELKQSKTHYLTPAKN